jgi:hypothetical protein
MWLTKIVAWIGSRHLFVYKLGPCKSSWMFAFKENTPFAREHSTFNALTSNHIPNQMEGKEHKQSTMKFNRYTIVMRLPLNWYNSGKSLHPIIAFQTISAWTAPDLNQPFPSQDLVYPTSFHRAQIPHDLARAWTSLAKLQGEKHLSRLANRQRDRNKMT